jgi:cytochrome c oxidase subunit II
MSDEQDSEHNSVLGWVLGLAVFIAIAVSLITGMMGAMSGTAPAKSVATPALVPVATAPTVVQVPAPAPAIAATAVAIPAAAKIYFASGSFASPADINQLLAGFAPYAASSPNAKIAISGFHDKSGDPVANAELAKNRAKSVLQVLKAAGIAEDRVMLKKPEEVMGGTDAKEARRVEVYVVQ